MWWTSSPHTTSQDQLQKHILTAQTAIYFLYNCKFKFQYHFQWSNFWAVYTDDPDTSLSCGNHIKDYCGDASKHTPISYNVSFQTTSVCHRFVINNEAVVWNLFTDQWIVDFEGNERPWNHLLNFYSTYYRGSYIHRFKHTTNGCVRLATPVPVPSQLSNFEHGQY